MFTYILEHLRPEMVEKEVKKMSDRNPIWKPSLLEANKQSVIEFLAVEPAATGQSKYGVWEMFPIKVENLKVQQDKEVIEGYTGEAVVFISEGTKISKKFMKGIEKGVMSFLVTKIAKESKRGGFYSDFTVLDLEGNEFQ